MAQTASDIFDSIKTRIPDFYPAEEATSLAYWIVEECLGWRREDVLLNNEVDNLEPFIDRVWEVVNKLAEGLPIQHIFGYAYFYERKYLVNSDVLIPRQETEELIHWILETTGNRSLIRLLDIGTGTGVIPITLTLENPRIRATGWDNSRGALETAEKNGRSLHAIVEWRLIDIFHPGSSIEKYDLIVSNPPYITAGEKESLDKNVLFDPPESLFVPDDDPLIFYRAIANFAVTRLNTGGNLFLEIHERFGHQISALLHKKGFKDIVIRKDLNGKDRMIMAIL